MKLRAAASGVNLAMKGFPLLSLQSIGGMIGLDQEGEVQAFSLTAKGRLAKTAFDVFLVYDLDDKEFGLRGQMDEFSLQVCAPPRVHPAPLLSGPCFRLGARRARLRVLVARAGFAATLWSTVQLATPAGLRIRIHASACQGWGHSWGILASTRTRRRPQARDKDCPRRAPYPGRTPCKPWA